MADQAHRWLFSLLFLTDCEVIFGRQILWIKVEILPALEAHRLDYISTSELYCVNSQYFALSSHFGFGSFCSSSTTRF